MGLYSNFFALVNKVQNEDVDTYKNILKNKIPKYTGTEYWNLFGYVYMGPFVLSGWTREKLLKQFDESQQYAKDVFTALYYETIEDGCENYKIAKQAMDGGKAFAADAAGLGLSELLLKEIQNTILYYFSHDVSKYDECRLMQLYKIEDIRGERYHIPLNRSGRMHIGVINPWPGDLSAESEVLTRINCAAKEAGIKCTLLSDWGHILKEENQKKTDRFVDAGQLDLVITTHYLSPKVIDSFFYHALWNPPEIPLNLGEYNQYVTNNYLMNDDYLTYDMGGMRNHLQTILMNKPRNIDNTSMLTASFPESSMLEAKLENPKMFYCGMNWDKLVNHQNRHEGLFKLLDETGAVKFFGPDIMKNWGGIRPWEGYRCYQYPIPWDGFSILKEINECGVCLVISSDIHRRAGAVTNRAYEACAAGAVIISDNNEFMQKYFADAALFIYYNKNDPQDTFDQIMEKYNWILTHREEALAMAKRAQRIFRENFTLDKQLLRIVSNHPQRFFSIANDLFARDDSKRVLVTYILNSLDDKEAEKQLDIVIKNIRRQYYENIELVVAVDQTMEDFIKKYFYIRYPDAQYEAMELFDQKGARYLTDGQAIRNIQKCHEYDYYVNVSAREIWFYDHITTLVRSIEDNDAYGAYSGRAFLDSGDRYTRTDYFNTYSDAELSSVSDVRAAECPGEFMFTKEAERYLPDFVFDSLDGLEHFAYACILQVKNSLPVVFTRRMTDVDNGDIYDDRKTVLSWGMQVRLIQDMVRFELKSKRRGGENVTFNPLGQTDPGIINIVKDALLKVPMKQWILYRWHLAWARLAGCDTKRGRKHMMKVQTIRNLFFQYWS